MTTVLNGFRVAVRHTVAKAVEPEVARRAVRDVASVGRATSFRGPRWGSPPDAAHGHAQWVERGRGHVRVALCKIVVHCGHVYALAFEDGHVGRRQQRQTLSLSRGLLGDPARIQYERRNFYLLFATEDQKEGMRAFSEKRKPAFKGQ